MTVKPDAFGRFELPAAAFPGRAMPGHGFCECDRENLR